MGRYTSISGGFECDSEQFLFIKDILPLTLQSATKFILSPGQAELYMDGWSFPEKHVNWTKYVFFGGSIREYFLPYLAYQIIFCVKELLKSSLEEKELDGCFILDGEEGERHMWEIRNNRFNIYELTDNEGVSNFKFLRHIDLMYPFQTRKANPAEFPMILQLLKEAALAIQQKGLDQWHGWLQPTQESISWIQEGVSNGEFYFVENATNELMGMYRLSYSDERYWGNQTDNAGYVHSLVVRKQFAGENLGTKILNYIGDHLWENGINLLRLDCNAANKWLCHYYESQGFSQLRVKQMPHSVNNLYEKIVRRWPNS